MSTETSTLEKTQEVEDEIVLEKDSQLSQEEIFKIFEEKKLEPIINKRIDAILDLENEINKIAKGGSLVIDEVSVLVAIRDLKYKQLEGWQKIKTSIIEKNATEESIDSIIAEVKLYEEDVRKRTEELKNIRKNK